ncbi:MAG: META domain-containing protein [Sphingomicrobium sp.]
MSVLATASCEAPPSPPPPAAAPRGMPAAVPASAVDDGTFLEQIDPLGGQWQVERIGGKNLQRFRAWVHFSAGGLLNHGAGCAGGHPAFYRLDGNRITITRREPARIGKCGSGTAAAAAAASEQRLASFLDSAATWQKPDGRTLILSARDRTRAVLTRPVEPHRDIAGRWIIETIGGRPFVTERRPPTLYISMSNISAVGDCNRISGPFTIPATGRIVVTGQMISTEMGCTPEDGAEDALMARAMKSATAYRVQNGRLVFTGGPGMVLRRPPPPDRRLAGEYASCGNTLLGGYHEGPITLAIGARTMRDNAGCTAEYSTEGPRLIVRPANTRACAATATPYVPGEPVSIGGAISTLALTQPDGFGFDDEGRLLLRTHRGLLMMCRKGSPPPFGG